jgi:hypothetical protein
MLSLVLLVAAVSDFEVWSAPPALTQEIEGSSARILVIGDWGGQGSRPFYTKPQAPALPTVVEKPHRFRVHLLRSR